MLSHGAAESIEKEEREVRDVFFRFAQENPGVLEDYQNSRDFTELLEENPELFEDAQSFVEALADQ